MTFRFRADQRLRHRLEFEQVYKTQCRMRDRYLLIYAARGASPVSRLGLSVSRKFGNSVKRSRMKRLIRESFRLLQNEIPRELDLIVIPQPNQPHTLLSTMKSLRSLSQGLHRKLTGVS